MAKKNTKVELADSAHKVWLAGLGALATAGAEGEKLFNSLVRRGETLEKQVQRPVESASARVSKTVKEARARAGETLESISSTVDDTVAMALGRLGVPSRAEIASLGKRVEKLTRAVEAKKQAGSTRPKAARKSSAKATAKKKIPIRKATARTSKAKKATRRKTAKPRATA